MRNVVISFQYVQKGCALVALFSSDEHPTPRSYIAMAAARSIHHLNSPTYGPRRADIVDQNAPICRGYDHPRGPTYFLRRRSDGMDKDNMVIEGKGKQMQGRRENWEE